jgi:predicted ribonuclease YlaK
MAKARNTEKKKDTSPKIHQNEKIKFDLNIRERDDLTEKQTQFLNLILDKKTKIVFVKGVAGTSKTYLSILAGLRLMNKKAVSDIQYVRSVVESASRSLGMLPGLASEKLQPFLSPMMDKLEELLPTGDINRLLDEERVKGTYIGHLRGASYNAKFVCFDEVQNFTKHELTVALTRIGEYSKFVFLADPHQVDPGVRSGFVDMYNLFNDEESRQNGIYCFEFGKEDVVRSGVLRFIAEKLENNNK